MEDGMADAAAKHRAIGKAPPQSRRRFDEQAEGSAAGFLLSRVPQQQKRPSRRLCAKIEPATFRQAKGFGIAVNFKDGCGKGPARQRRFRQPECIVEPARRCMENRRRIDAEPGYARDIRDTGFAGEKAVRDPEHGPALMSLHRRGKRQGKARCCPGIIHG
jgi:hypothetical protein